MKERYVVYDATNKKVLAIVLDERMANAMKPLFSALVEIEISSLSSFDFCFYEIRDFIGIT